jgi:hypothetical protein
LELQAIQVHLETTELPDLEETLVQVVHPDPLDQQAPRDPEGTTVMQEIQVNKVLKDYQEVPVSKDNQELEVMLDHLDNLESQVLKDRKDLLVIQEAWVTPAHQE